LDGEKRVELPVSTGALVISRFGRGGSILVIKLKGSEDKQYCFLSDFALQIRAATKEFLPVVGRLLMLIKQNKNFATDQSAQYMEYSNYLEQYLKSTHLTPVIKSIKQKLETGAVPHANLQQIFLRKREKKRVTRAQADIETSNILDWVYSNLPADLAKVRGQALRQTEEEQRMREQKKQQSDIERQRTIEARKLAYERKISGDPHKDSEEEKTGKTKTKTVKTKGADGFVTVDVTYKKLDELGAVVEETTASAKKVEVEQEVKKEKKKVQHTETAFQNNMFTHIATPDEKPSQPAQPTKTDANKSSAKTSKPNNSTPKKSKQTTGKTTEDQSQLKSSNEIKSASGKPKQKKPKVKRGQQVSEVSNGASTVSSPANNIQNLIYGFAAVAVVVLSWVFLAN